MEYSFHLYNKLAADGAAMALDKLLNVAINRKTKGAGTDLTQFYPSPVVVCIGSDLAIGDSLGPITGSMLKYKTQGANVFLYGTLSSPVTAKEIKYLRAFLKETHKNSPIIAIDAAVGNKGDIGLIKLSNAPLFPGAGANKKLGAVGDISIMGIVAEKSLTNYALLNTTRLNLVYSMSEIISDAVSALLWNRQVKEVKNA
jgi:putative sporulation protein YyaC